MVKVRLGRRNSLLVKVSILPPSACLPLRDAEINTLPCKCVFSSEVIFSDLVRLLRMTAGLKIGFASNRSRLESKVLEWSNFTHVVPYLFNQRAVSAYGNINSPFISPLSDYQGNKTFISTPWNFILYKYKTQKTIHMWSASHSSWLQIQGSRVRFPGTTKKK
jgi:hypothetical protein